MRARSTSAVACASGSARWQGRAAVPKKYASEERLARATRPPRTRRAGTKAGRLEVDDHVGRRLERKIVAERRRETDAVAAPGEAGVPADDVVQQAARQTGGDVP